MKKIARVVTLSLAILAITATLGMSNARAEDNNTRIETSADGWTHIYSPGDVVRISMFFTQVETDSAVGATAQTTCACDLTKISERECVNACVSILDDNNEDAISEADRLHTQNYTEIEKLKKRRHTTTTTRKSFREANLTTDRKISEATQTANREMSEATQRALKAWSEDAQKTNEVYWKALEQEMAFPTK